MAKSVRLLPLKQVILGSNPNLTANVESSKGRTVAFEATYLGSNPSATTKEGELLRQQTRPLSEVHVACGFRLFRLPPKYGESIRRLATEPLLKSDEANALRGSIPSTLRQIRLQDVTAA